LASLPSLIQLCFIKKICILEYSVFYCTPVQPDRTGLGHFDSRRKCRWDNPFAPFYQSYQICPGCPWMTGVLRCSCTHSATVVLGVPNCSTEFRQVNYAMIMMSSEYMSIYNAYIYIYTERETKVYSGILFYIYIPIPICVT
jgi:hypothetical protein